MSDRTEEPRQKAPAPNAAPEVWWNEAGARFMARWRSEAGDPPPERISAVDDRLRADAALRRLRDGEGLLWRGDWRNARQLLSAIEHRLARPGRKRAPPPNLREAFHRGRAQRASRHAVLARHLVCLDEGWVLRAKGAPDVAAACAHAWGDSGNRPTLVPLRELLGVLGAEEWRRVGLEVPGLPGRIHPRYGVFTPTRGDYPALLAKAPSPSGKRVLDVGTGTGVLGFLLLQAGATSVVGTDLEPRAVACANENASALGFPESRFRAVEADLFPSEGDERWALVVCNPPWIPARPRTPLDRAIYDPEGEILSRFLEALPEHLAPGGEGWLILSDLPERLGLRESGAVEALVSRAGLEVLEKLEVAPTHPAAHDPEDPLHAARAAERTRLWRLAPR